MVRRFGDRRSLLREQTHHPRSFISHERPDRQLCLERIAPDVARDIQEMISIADQPIKIILLPDRPGAVIHPVDFRGREPFPTGDGFSEIGVLA